MSIAIESNRNRPELKDADNYAGLDNLVLRRALELRAQYSNIYNLNTVSQADGSLTFDKAILFRRSGINALFLKGSSFEMAFQHGKLLREEIQKGAVGAAAKLVENAVNNSIGHWPSIAKFAGRLSHTQITDKIFDFAMHDPEHFGSGSLDSAIGLSEASGVPFKTLIDAFLNPEALTILANYTNPTFGVAPAVCAPASCCSSFAAWGDKTQNGDIIYGRNMDFPLNGRYDLHPTVIYYEPTDGDQRYMSIVSAGVENSGLNVYNESGLFVACHVVASTEVSRQGMPTAMTARVAIGKAETYDELVDLLRSHLPPAGWGYLIGSTREKRVGSIEFSSRHSAVRESLGDFHVQTNNYVIPQMKAYNLFINQSITADNDARFNRISERIEKCGSKLDPAEAMDILSDHFDPYSKRQRGLGATVGMHSTMTSFVLLPAENQVYIASGKGPVSHGKFVAFPLVGEGTTPESFRNYEAKILENSRFQTQYPEMYEAMKLYIEAKKAHEYENDSKKAFEILKEVVKIDPSNPAYFFVLGIFALRNQDFAYGKLALQQVFKTEYSTPQLNRLAHYYLGRIEAHQGNWPSARDHLYAVIRDKETDSKLMKAAKMSAYIARAFGWYPLSKSSLVPGMQWADMMGY